MGAPLSCVVVGSGIAGMTAALLLARVGHDITLLESGPRLAPLLRGFWREGLHFDTGFHYGGGVHQKGVLRRWLKALGVEKSLHFFSGHEDHIHFTDGQNYVLPSGEALPERMEHYFPGHGASMQLLMDNCADTLRHSPYTNPALHSEPAMRWKITESVPERLATLNMPPHMAELLTLHCLLYGVPPAQASWDDYALVAGPYFQSSGTWQGGGEALVQALEKELHTAGVRVRCRATLAGLELTPHKAVQAALLSDGTRIPCQQCFFTGHPRQLAHILPTGALRPVFLNHVRELPETSAPIMLFAETRAMPRGRNIFLLPAPAAADRPDNSGKTDKSGNSGRSDREGSEGTKGKAPSGAHLFTHEHAPCPSIYLACGHPAPDADPERIPLLAMGLVHPDSMPAVDASPAAWRAYKAQTVARLMANVEARCPELRGAWRVLDSATARSMRHWIHGSTGSVYGVLHDRENMPLLPVTRVSGLFLAGQNILLPGVLGGIVSAALAVGFAHGHEVALKDFRQTCVEDEAS